MCNERSLLFALRLATLFDGLILFIRDNTGSNRVKFETKRMPRFGDIVPGNIPKNGHSDAILEVVCSVKNFDCFTKTCLNH